MSRAPRRIFGTFPIQSTKDFHQHGNHDKWRGNIIEKLERKEILNATDYFMNNQYDHLDLDVYNLFVDESDVGARVELEERLRQSKSLCTGRRTQLKKKSWMLCDERYIFEDNDVEILFEITNEHIAAVLRPNSLSRL